MLIDVVCVSEVAEYRQVAPYHHDGVSRQEETAGGVHVPGTGIVKIDADVEASGGGGVGTLTRKQLAAVLQVSANTVSDMVSRGEAPEPMVNRDRMMLWSRAMVQRWIDSGLSWGEYKKRGGRR